MLVWLEINKEIEILSIDLLLFFIFSLKNNYLICLLLYNQRISVHNFFVIFIILLPTWNPKHPMSNLWWKFNWQHCRKIVLYHELCLFKFSERCACLWWDVWSSMNEEFGLRCFFQSDTIFRRIDEWSGCVNTYNLQIRLYSVIIHFKFILKYWFLFAKKWRHVKYIWKTRVLRYKYELKFWYRNSFWCPKNKHDCLMIFILLFFH